MSPALIAALILGYLILARPVSTAYRTGTVAPATAQTSPAGTTITIPGVGTYQNVYGGGVSVSLNPQLLAGLFGTPTQEPAQLAGTQPILAAPALSYGYVPELAIEEPVPPWMLAAPVPLYEAV